jgi:hypothetical protein
MVTPPPGVDRRCLAADGRYKRRYPDRAAARRAARLDGRRYGITLRIYPCPGCSGYHTTTQRPADG